MCENPSTHCGTIVEILEAYCVELDQVLTIYDAQKAYWALPAVNRKRFTFRCSDHDCRAENNPLVSGINYDKLAEDSNKYRQIHFRAHTNHPHVDTCYWKREEVLRGKPDTVDTVDNKARVGRAKKTNVIDVFNPKVSDDCVVKASPSTSGPRVDGKPREVQEPKEKYRAREGYSSTTRLERFIDCWSQLDADELKQNEVVLAGRTLSYRQAVTHPEWITPTENGTRILQGGVKAALWPKDAPKWLYLNFMSKCDKFPGNQGGKGLTIALPMSLIDAYNGGAMLLEKIRLGQSKGHYVKVYCWGDIKARDNHEGYVLDVVSLDNLVIKAVAVKPREPSQE